MAGMAARMVLAFLEAHETKVNKLKDGILRVGWAFEGGSMDIFFQFDETDCYVHLEGINFIKVPADKYERMYKVLNQCNDEYTHIKFVLDTGNGQICARDDDVIQLDSCGEECYELMYRMVKVVEAAYPKFMKAIWA